MNEIKLDVPFADYKKWPAFGSSDLKAMRLGPPAMVRWLREHPTEDTDATRLGSAAHCAILEEGQFSDRYAHKPEDMKFSTKDGIAWKAAHQGQSILTHDQWTTVVEIVTAFCAKKHARKSLDTAQAREASLSWTDPATGLQLKGRPDWYDGEYVTDLKITRHAIETYIPFRAYAEGWLHQLAHYRTGLNECGVPCKGGRLVLINPKPPHSVYLVEPSSDALDMCALDNESTVFKMAVCQTSGIWPGTPDSWESIDVPDYALTSGSLAVGAIDDEESDDV